jgi:hemerythrin superfamily protein
MDAIQLLESQHREVEDLFEEIEGSNDNDEKTELFEELADKLAVHASIEEHHFYPAVKDRRTKDILLESLEEHLAIKRILADLLESSAEDETFDAQIKVLKETVSHHVEEEEGDLFPKVRKLFNKDELEALGQEMSAEQAELEERGAPRREIPSETEQAARI